MALTQPFPHVPRTFRLHGFLRGLTNSCIPLVALVLWFTSSAHAQGGVPLVTVATDQSPLNLSNQFGVPAGTAINQAGDFAFVGNGDSALFLRAAGASAATRLLQIDDELPGFPGSQILSFLPELSINSSRKLFFGVRISGGDDEGRSALLIYDGTNYHTVVTSDEIAPGSGAGFYGFNLAPGSIDDSGDVDFAAVPTGTGSTTFYIFPSGAQAAVRILGLNDNPPPPPTPCTNCFFVGVPTGGTILVGSPSSILVPRLNANGQMLLSLWNGLFIGSKDGTLSPVPTEASGACSIQPVTNGNAFNPFLETGAFLNNTGAVAFTNPLNSSSTTICVAPPGGIPKAVIASGKAAPAGVGGGTIFSPVALGFNDSGDIIFQSPISGSNLTIFALLRYHQSNGPTTDVVAYNCEAAQDSNGSVFSIVPLPSSVSCGPSGVISLLSLSSPFQGISVAQDGRVSFQASLASGKSAIYRQTGANAPEFISFESDGTTFLAPRVRVGIFSSNFFFSSGLTEILNNGSVVFASYLTGGAADFAVSLGTPGNVQSLMSTADLLPSGPRTILGGSPPQVAGHFVLFTAQPAAGRINLLESDLTSGTITRVVSDNDPAFATAGGPPGNPVVAPNFFLNESGQVAFETVGANTGLSGIGIISFGSPTNSVWSESNSTCGTIYLWSPSGGLKKVVAAGDAAPNTSVKFSCVTLNSGSPSPLNSSGQLAFTSPSPFPGLVPCSLCDPFNPAAGVNGVYVYSPGVGISEIAAANDTLPLPVPTQATTFVPNLSVPVNSHGQVAFGAQVGTTAQGFFLRNGDATQEVVAMGDSVPGTSATFGFPHFIAGLTDSGNFAFTAATSAAADGLFFAPAGGAIQTLALDGGAAPGTSGGTFSFTPPAVVTPPGTFIGGINFLQNFATINGESDVAFGAKIAGGSTDSGYFRVLQNGPAAGTPQAVVWQGQAVPGGGTFNTIPVPSGILSFLTNLGSNFALGPDGDLAFVNTFLDSAPRLREGMFVARPDGTLVKVVATGDFVPGGGVLTGLSMRPKLAAGEAGKFAFFAGIAGGSARRAVFVTAIPPGAASTTITLSPPQSPAVAQQSTTLSATVTSATAGTLSGTVTFFDNGISLGAGAVNASGQATVTTSSLTAGLANLVAQYDGDSKFAPGNSTPQEVVVAGFVTPPAGLSVAAGKSLVIPLTAFAPASPVMSFTLSCSKLPANATCMFDMNPVTPGPNGTTVHLTLTTMAGSNLLPAQPRKGPPSLMGCGLATLLAGLFAAAALVWRQVPRWRLVSCACLATFALALAIGGCGAVGYSSSTPVTPGPGTPAGPASFTVTGTSGTTTVSTVVNVTIQ
jgi:hypothetical protein